MFGHAKGWKHSGYQDRGHDNYSFWHDVDDRQYSQADRINHGVENGQLTRREARQLYREQQHINKEIHYLKDHRYLSSVDKRDVLEHLNYLHEQIWHLKHNDQYVQRVRHNLHSRNHDPFISRNNSWGVR